MMEVRAGPKPLVPLLRVILGKLAIDISEASDLEVGLRLVGRADERQIASLGQDHDQVASRLDVGQAVGDAHHRLATVGHLDEAASPRDRGSCLGGMCELEG